MLVPRRVQCGHVHLTISPPKVGKSSILLSRSMALSTGRDLLGEGIVELARVWVINNEEPAEELDRRIAGIMLHHGITLEELRGRFYRSCGYGHPYVLITESGKPAVAEALGAGLVRVGEG